MQVNGLSTVGEGRVVAFIDIGTNSIRLMIVRLFPNCTYNVLTNQKEVVRLGEGEFGQEMIHEEAMDRAVIVCKNFVELARSFGTEEFVAVATSATREAHNRNHFLNRIRHEAGIDVGVISGREEARLIYMGVVSGTHIEDCQTIFIDIGGGSTEISIGNQHSYHFLDSLRLGSIRLTNQYFKNTEKGPIPKALYEQIKRHVKNELIRPLNEMKGFHLDLAIGSSGTIINLAEIASRLDTPVKSEELSLNRESLRQVSDILCSVPLAQRRKIPGINPERADIIIAGAAILDTIMDELDLDHIQVSTRGLKEGLLAEYLSRMEDFPLLGQLTLRERSVLQLARSCGINELHARTVSRLALELFDSALIAGIHQYGEKERELLLYATFLHDIGSFISYTNHHAHSYYLIRNTEMLGFDQKEIATMAYITRFHRKKAPGKKQLQISGLDKNTRGTIRLLSAFLRLAESLDRSHTGLIRHARFVSSGKKEARLGITATGDCQLEIWGVENEVENFSRVFQKKLVAEVVFVDIDDPSAAGCRLPPLLNHISENP
jgi:exopolyphosphatase/guanosine-5'-triphosphate,3'-diphosphate pyrophosphatase